MITKKLNRTKTVKVESPFFPSIASFYSNRVKKNFQFFLISISRTIRHRVLDAGRDRGYTRGHDNDTSVRMVVTIRFQHEGKPFRRCAETIGITINFASY